MKKMGKVRPCPYCPGGHRTKRAAKKCFQKHMKQKKWTAAELGLR